MTSVLEVRPAQLLIKSGPDAGDEFEIHCSRVSTSVALALVDLEAEVFALAHFLLPRSPNSLDEEECALLKTPLDKDPSESLWIYGETAIPSLFQAFHDHGGKRRNLMTYLIGGSDFLGLEEKNRIGYQNVRLARRILSKNSILLTGTDCGGQSLRHITLRSTGEVQVQSPGLEPLDL